MVGQSALRGVQRPGSFFTFVAAVLAIFALSSRSSATPEGVGYVQVRVAMLDGRPVYHWRAFTSGLRNDVDRALILQEFERHKYVLPEKVLDDRMSEAVRMEFHGSQDKLVQALAVKGANLADCRRFLREEIIVSAMLYEETSKWKRQSKPTESQWLALLHKGRRIVALPPHRDTNKDSLDARTE